LLFVTYREPSFLLELYIKIIMRHIRGTPRAK